MPGVSYISDMHILPQSPQPVGMIGGREASADSTWLMIDTLMKPQRCCLGRTNAAGLPNTESLV